MGSSAVAYDESFHAKRGGYREPAERCLLAAFAHFGVPDSFLDLGCGTGDLVRLAVKLEVDAIGVDLSAPPDSEAERVFRHDLRLPLTFRTFDRFSLVWCTEVAEHLDDPKELLSAIVRYADDRVIWTAAHPGQGGVGHLFERPREFWIEQFALRGFRCDPVETEELRSTWRKVAGRCRWYYENLSVFRRSRG